MQRQSSLVSAASSTNDDHIIVSAVNDGVESTVDDGIVSAASTTDSAAVEAIVPASSTDTIIDDGFRCVVESTAENAIAPLKLGKYSFSLRIL